MTENENNTGAPESKYEEFYCCYLLRSLAPKHKQTSYIGSTNDPKRRLRQHNGEIALGAKKTESKRPWEMVLFVYGFPNHTSALQFEWSWQNPSKTRRLHLTSDDEFRENDDRLSTSLRAISKMLKDKFWSRWPLHLHIMVSLKLITLQNRIMASTILDVTSLPKKIRITHGKVEEFNDYHKGLIRNCVRNEYSKFLDHTKNNLFCNLCLENIDVNDHKSYLNCLNMECNVSSHLACLAKKFTKSEVMEMATLQNPYNELEEEIIPIDGKCCSCQITLSWGDLIHAMMIREKYVQNDLVIKI
ncbi:2630_t:CDS:1 [Funneliformis geosporum]|uniref:18544_t:CDS:1 n=1 Tax=Funneliformis geosporum TaxID=1117311 RepID=A0A9W4SHW4_9GLOM|nr:18544_t:CDS:1 [Funneliformis geosporum]CAI2171101.1 2630_t:CDS:1 [Funneliformis geosporum]